MKWIIKEKVDFIENLNDFYGCLKNLKDIKITLNVLVWSMRRLFSSIFPHILYIKKESTHLNIFLNFF